MSAKSKKTEIVVTYHGQGHLGTWKVAYRSHTLASEGMMDILSSVPGTMVAGVYERERKVYTDDE